MSWEVFRRAAPRRNGVYAPPARVSHTSCTFNAAALALFDAAGLRLGGRCVVALNPELKLAAFLPDDHGWKLSITGTVAFTRFAVTVGRGIFPVRIDKIQGGKRGIVLDYSHEVEAPGNVMAEAPRAGRSSQST